MNKRRLPEALLKLVALVSRLREPGGCPWDAQQTDSSIRMYLIEEAYEVLDAVEKGFPEDVCEELGDLLFQIIFLADLADNRGEFDLEDVIEKITEKMIYRHPHVFGNVKLDTPSEVSDNWHKIKIKEKGQAQSNSVMLNDIPKALPALLMAHRLSEKASKVGFDWNGKEEIREKVIEEFHELDEALSTGKRDRIKEEIGDLFFSLVNLARHWKFNSEDLLRDANQKFLARFELMETSLREKGIGLEEATSLDMDRAWEEIKKR